MFSSSEDDMDSYKRTKKGRTSAAMIAMLLALANAPVSGVAQQLSLGGSGVLGAFQNPLTVTPIGAPVPCTYTLLQIDMATGAVFVQPDRAQGNNAVGSCFGGAVLTGGTGFSPPLTLASLFSGSLPASFPTGVFEVTDFTLRQSNASGTTSNVTLQFLRNDDNTPVIIRSNGPTGVTINAGQVLNLEGQAGGEVAATGGLLRGSGGIGGPGGYRGADGGNGGQSPSTGGSGFGPGGGQGGAIDSVAGPARFATTGVVLPQVLNSVLQVPATGGADLLTQLRGGSGGGGGGGLTGGAAGRGGGGGGGAILIAADRTITVNGTLTARGGDAPLARCSPFGTRGASAGSGGAIRLVASTIAGNGTLTAAAGSVYSSCGEQPGVAGSDNGGIRIEAFTISFNGTLTGQVGASSAPGQVIVPSDAPSVSNPFIHIARLRDSSNPTNCVSASVSDGSCATLQRSVTRFDTQTVPGRTGKVAAPDAIMPNATAAATAVDVDVVVGPIPGFPTVPRSGCTPSVSSLCYNLTLVVTPVDPGQGTAKNYTAPISLVTDPVFCPGTPCKTSITNVTLPLGSSGFSAFVVLNLQSGGTLARNFPAVMENEPVESVRLETDGKEMKYVLISKSGREFPYVPGANR
jgi:hypothetical protein